MNNNRHLLVIRLSAMGDVAMTVPVLKVLTETYPQLKITVLTRAFFAPLFNRLENVDVHIADVKDKHKGAAGLWRLYKEIRSIKVDAVADLHNVLRSNILKRFFVFGGIPFVQIDKGRKEKKELTSLKDKVFKPLKSTHQRYAEVFGKLGYTIDLALYRALTKMALPKNAATIMGDDFNKWIGLAPFAAFDGKMYPLHLMEQVVEQLSETKMYKIALFGGGDKEKQLLDQWAAKYPLCSTIIGRLTFEEELALISNLDLMLSMDSGNAHLAAIFGIPTITLWGVTHPYAGFPPFGQDPSHAILSDREKYPLIPTSIYGNKFPTGYEAVMETIDPSEVTKKVNQLLM